MTEIDSRASEILAAIVQEYIISGEAVGSRTLVRRRGIEHSPATVRNVMADLEEQGLLTQPHTSAGRVPTASGLRYFVDRLMHARSLTSEEQAEILGRYNLNQGELQEMLRDVSSLLSDVSQQCAVVLVPRSEVSVLKRIEFVPIASDQLIAVIVMASGLVQNRLIRTREPIPPNELERMHNYLNRLCEGKQLTEVRELVLREMERGEAQYDRVMQRALRFGVAAVERPVEDELVIQGRAKLFDNPAIDRAQLQALIKDIDQKREVLRMLDETMTADGVKVFIGSESSHEDLGNLTVIASAYGENRALGTLGVIGPSNMDYPRLVPLVDFTAGLLTNLLRR